MIVDAMVKANTDEAWMAACDVVAEAKKSFSDSKKLEALVNTVGDASHGTKDPKLKSKLEGLGYAGKD